MKKSEAYLPII